MSGNAVPSITGRHTGNPAIERMFEDGRLEKVGPETEKTSSQLWSVAYTPAV